MAWVNGKWSSDGVGACPFWEPYLLKRNGSNATSYKIGKGCDGKMCGRDWPKQQICWAVGSINFLRGFGGFIGKRYCCHFGAVQTRHFHNLQLLEHVDHMLITHPKTVATVVLGSTVTLWLLSCTNVLDI